MGGEYESANVQLTYVFSSSGTPYIYNYNVLPGLAFATSNNNSTYYGISIMDGAKLNDIISSDMTYNELAGVIGEFEVSGVAQSVLVYNTVIDGYNVTFCFEDFNGDYAKYMINGYVPSEILHDKNPTLHSIGLRTQ